MSTELRRRRGSAAQTATFTGAQGEITVDLTNKAVVVHDSVTPGGKRGATVDDLDNLSSSAVGTAIAGQLTGDLGTTAWLVRRTISTEIIAGTNYAGTDLSYYGLNTDNSPPSIIQGNPFGAALSGTYKAMGTSGVIASYYPINLFVKVAT